MSSPYFKQSNTELLPIIEVNFCLFNHGTVSYVSRTLAQVKQVMQRIQRRVVNSPTEQSEIAKWHMEIERYEQEENFIRIASIIECFFATVHRKIVENSIQLNKQVIVEDIEGLGGPQYFYVNEFIDFFDLSTSFSTHDIRPFEPAPLQNDDEEEEVLLAPPDHEYTLQLEANTMTAAASFFSHEEDTLL